MASSTFIKTAPHVSAELQEELPKTPIQVKGTIPSWLSGTFVRNGPVTVTVDGKKNDHWFDGLAMLHAFTFDHEQVTYTNRFLRTQAYQTVFEDGSLHYLGFAVDPCKSLFKRLFTWFIPQSKLKIANANINVAKLDEQLVALYEVHLPVKFDPETLETLGVLNYQDELPKEQCWTSAHPHYDAKRKETINYLIEFGRNSFYTFYRIADGSNKRELIAQIPVEEPSYMHSFAVTQNYLILTAFPLVVRPILLALQWKPFIKNFKWEPERGTEFIVIDRKSGKIIQRAKTKPFFAFHHINAFEEGQTVHLDIAAYPDAEVITGDFFYQNVVDKPNIPIRTAIERFSLQLPSGTIRYETLFEQTAELPRVHPALDGLPYRYAYFAGEDMLTPHVDFNSLYKVDTKTKTAKQWKADGCHPGEPIFIASPNAVEEDDGIVISIVLEPKKKKSFLLMLDAKEWREIARAEVPLAIPLGLHGQFFNL